MSKAEKKELITKGDMLIYKGADGNSHIDVHVDSETLWLTQMQMGELFGVQKAAISKHLMNIFISEELDKKSVVSVLETTAADGKKYDTNYYNLDAIIAVGYRVNSKKATTFRIWATNVLKEYIIKGFAMDDDRLKNLGRSDIYKGRCRKRIHGSDYI